MLNPTRRSFLFGGIAAAIGLATIPIWADSGQAIAGTGSVLTRPAAPVLPDANALNTTIQLTNPAGQPTQTSPFFSFGIPLARGHFFTATQKLALYDQTGSARITDVQVDMTSANWSDGSVNYVTVTGYATNVSLAAGVSQFFRVRAIPGSSPKTPVCTASQLAASSDIKAICKSGADTFTVSMNAAIAAVGGTPATYPQTYFREWKSGPYLYEVCGGGYPKRNGDGALHRWNFVKLYVGALSPTGPFIVRGYLESPLSYGSNPLGSVGLVSTVTPQVIWDSIEIYNGTTFICALGGQNDLNNSTFPAAGVNTTTGQINATTIDGVNAATAYGNSRNPIGFTSTGTLPAGLDPTVTYWAARDLSTGTIVPCLSRNYAERVANSPKITSLTAGQDIPFNRWICSNGAVYTSTSTALHNYSSGAMPTGDVFTDTGSATPVTWTRISTRLTSTGSGTHSMVLKSAVWGGSKAPIMGPDTYPFWSGAGSLPKLLIGYDRDYVIRQAMAMLPLDPAINPAPWVGALPRYIQNMTYLPGMTSAAYIGNVGESQMDERINLDSPTMMSSVCLPTDRGLAMSSRLIALSWVDRNSSWRDERSQEIAICNYGPDRLGGQYPGMAPNNPKLWIGDTRGTSASPKMIGFAGWTGYGGDLSSSSAPDAAHTPNAPYWAALTSGDPMFMDAEIELGGFIFGGNGVGSPQTRSALFNGVNLSWAWPLMAQQRAAGHELRVFSGAHWITPDAHPAKQYFSDIIEDSSKIGMLWMDNNMGPNAKATGYLPFLYPTGSWQAQETWMLTYLHIAMMDQVLKDNLPGWRQYLTTYGYKALLPLWDSDVGGSELLIDEQWNAIGNVNSGGPDPALDSQLLLTVPDRLAGNPVIFHAYTVIPPPLGLFINYGSNGASSYIYRQPGQIGTLGSGNSAAFPGQAYGLSSRALCEMGTMANIPYYKKIADRIQAVIDTKYAGNPCNWTAQATSGCTNGIMYAMKRQ